MATTRGDIRAFNRRLEDLMSEVREAGESMLATVLNMAVDDLEVATPLGNPALWHPPVWPPGYMPGTARDGWTILVDGLPARSVRRVSAKSRIRIVNSVPYMESLNRGHSTQAPAGWVEQTFGRIRTKIQALKFAPPGFRYVS